MFMPSTDPSRVKWSHRCPACEPRASCDVCDSKRHVSAQTLESWGIARHGAGSRCRCCGTPKSDEGVCVLCDARILLECPAREHHNDCQVCRGDGFVTRAEFRSWVCAHHRSMALCPECDGREGAANECGFCYGLTVVSDDAARWWLEEDPFAAGLGE